MGATPLYAACMQGHLDAVQQLCSYGATRTAVVHGRPADVLQVAEAEGFDVIASYLKSSLHWTTPLHHLGVIDAARARCLLRGGASLHVSHGPAGDTPLSLARRLHAARGAENGTAAALVLEAAQPWRPSTHALFPNAARARAVEIVLITHRLSRLWGACGQAGALFEVLMDRVLPELVSRESIPSCQWWVPVSSWTGEGATRGPPRSCPTPRDA